MGTFPVVDGHQWKAQVPFLARHFRVVTVDPRGNGRSGRPTGAAAYSDDVNAGRRARRAGRHRHGLGVPGRAVLGHQVVAAGGRGGPGAGARHRRDRTGRAPAGAAARPDRARRRTSAGRGDCGGLGRLPLRHCSCPSRTRPRPSRTWSAGRSRPTRPRSPRAPTPPSGRARRRRRSTWSAGSTCPLLVMHGDRGPVPAARAGPRLRRAHRGAAGRARGRRPRPARPAPGAGQHRDQGVRRHAHHLCAADGGRDPLAVRPRAQAAGAVGLLADRPGPRAARPGHRPGPARAGAGPRDRVAGPVPRDRRGARARRGRAPGQQPSWPRSRRTGRARPSATTCTPSTPSAGWTRSSAPTTCSSTTSSARRRTTCGSVTSRGRSTTSCTRTPSARSRRTPSSPTWSASCRSTRSATPARSSCAPTTTPR